MAQAEIFTINVQPIVDQMKVLGTAIGQTKDQLSKLTDEEKKTTDEGIRLSTQLKAQQKEYNSLSTVVTNQKSAVNELSKATKSNTDLMNIESNSIATNRKLYNALYGEIVNTTAATEAEKKALDKKIETAKQVNDVLKNQEKALGDTRRNVGNYEGALKNAVSEIKIFGVSLGSLNTTFNTYKAALGDAKTQLAAYITGQKAADGATKLSILSTGGLSAAMNVLKLALIATGVGAFVVLIGSLVAAFASTERGADLLEDALGRVTGVFKSLFGEAQKIGVELINIFSSPKKAISDLVDFLKNNLVNSLKGFGVVLDGILERDTKKLTNGLAQIVTGVTDVSGKIQNAAKNTNKFISDAAKRGQDLVNIQRELEDLEGKIGKERAKTASRETELLIIAKQSSSTQKERKAATDEILKNTADLQKLEEDIVSKKIQALKLSQSQNITDREGNKELQDLEGELIKVRDAGKDKQLSLIKLLNKEEKNSQNDIEKARQKKEADDAKALADSIKAAKDEEDRLNKIADRNASLEELRINTLITGQQQEEALFELAFEKRIEDLRALNLTEVQIEEIKQKELKAIQQKYAQEQIARDAETFNKQVALNDKLLQNDLELVDLSVDSEENKNKRKQEIQIKYLKEQIELTKKFFGELSEEEKAQLQSLQNALDKLMSPAKKEGRETFASALGINEEELAKAQTELQDFQQAVNAVGTAINTIYELRLQTIENQKNSEIDAVNASALNEEQKKAKIAELNKKYAMEQYKIQKEQFEVNKAVQIVQAIIGGALGVINAISQLGPIAGAIAAIAVAATTAAQIAIISSQKPPPPPKFAKGVIGLRGPGTSTSDNIDAKLSRGESVMTAKATEAFSEQLAMMELAVGNKPNYQFGKGRFATGFIPTTDGGFSARQTAQSSLNSVAMAETVISAVRSIPPPVLEYSEFTRFTNGVNKSVQVSEL
jgi:hypothetical protein